MRSAGRSPRTRCLVTSPPSGALTWAKLGPLGPAKRLVRGSDRCIPWGEYPRDDRHISPPIPGCLGEDSIDDKPYPLSFSPPSWAESTPTPELVPFSVPLSRFSPMVRASVVAFDNDRPSSDDASS